MDLNVFAVLITALVVGIPAFALGFRIGEDKQSTYSGEDLDRDVSITEGRIVRMARILRSQWEEHNKKRSVVVPCLDDETEYVLTIRRPLKEIEVKVSE